ncbi:MAG TPA: tetratricopeptide repeat protein [Chitinophagaceae bacterium]
MAEIKHAAPVANEHHVRRPGAEQFWTKYSKPLTIGFTVIILAVAGFFIYRSMVTVPNARKAEESVFKAEEYYRMDSLDKALNGDGVNQGLLRIISRYGGSEAGNRARMMAGSIYLRKGDYKNAIKHLEEFKTDVKQIKARNSALLADAYAEMGAATNNNGNKEKAAGLYEEAAGLFEKDDLNAPEYLFRAGYLYESMGKTQEAIEAYKKIKAKYPRSERGFEIDKYLARLGVVE